MMRSLENQAGWHARVQWMLAGGAALLVAGFFLLGYRPVIQRQAALGMQIEAKERQLKAEQDHARRLPEVARSVDNLRIRLEHFDKRLPRTDDLSSFIREVTQMSQQASLRKLLVEKGGAHRADVLGELPILLQFEGDFVSAFAFVRQLEEMQRMTRVRKLELNTTDGKLGTVEVKMTVSIYSMEG